MLVKRTQLNSQQRQQLFSTYASIASMFATLSNIPINASPCARRLLLTGLLSSILSYSVSHNDHNNVNI